MDVVSYLDSKNVEVKETGAGQAYTQCFFCNEDPQKRGRLYFNTDSGSDKYGLYNCFLCNESGNLKTLLHHFGDDTSVLESHDYTNIFNVAADYYAERLMQNVEAFEYLLYERGLTEESIERFKLGYCDGGLLQYLLGYGFTKSDVTASGLVNHFGNDFLDGHIIIPYFDYGDVVGIRGKKIGGKYMSLPGSSSMLYGIDAIRGQRDVIITAGEFDAMVLQQLGYNACGAPGENIFKPEWIDEFESAGRVFILYDNDKAGTTGSEKVAAKFGPRARVAELPKGDRKIDVTTYYVDMNKTVEDFDMLLIKAKGGLLVTAHQAYDRWLEIEGNPHLVGVRFNISELDNVMTHGLLPGQVTTLLARTNAGKTIMTINMLYRMIMEQNQRDLQILYVSLEQTRNEWFERAHRIHNFYNPNSTELDTLAFWDQNFLMIDKNRLSSEELEACIDQYAFETGRYPDIVAIDYLGYFARSYRGDEYTRVTDAIMDAKAIAKERQIVMIIPHQGNRQSDFGKELSPDQGRGSGAVEETSDVMLGLWAPDQMVGVDNAQQKRRLHLKIMKSRDGGVGTKFEMQFAPLTLAVVPPSDVLYPRAIDEVQMAVAGDDWKKAVYRHETGDRSI